MPFLPIRRVAVAGALLGLFPVDLAAAGPEEAAQQPATALESEAPERDAAAEADTRFEGENPQPEAGAELADEDYDPLFDEDFDDFGLGPEIYDPWEPANRAVFRFNQGVDDWVFDPVTAGYRFVTPEPVRRGIYRAFENLNTPVYLVNNLLQLRFLEAGETLAAFALNTTLGIGGLLEPSREANLELQPADFGQTLQTFGVGAGPYLVVPILGPSTLRDGIGSVVDRFLQPLTYFLGLPTQLLWGGGAGLSLRDDVDDELDALEESSVDFYSALRSAYLQSRAHLPERQRLWGQSKDPSPGISALK